MKKKIIQVPMPSELLEQLDEVAAQRGESRSFMIREACAEYIASSREAELVRQYIEEYERTPETREEREWVETATALAAETLAGEDWSKEYEEFVRAEEESLTRDREKG